MTNQQRINALVSDMENWDNDNVLDWALAQYRENLEDDEEISVLIQYTQVFGETHGSQD